MAQGVGVSRWPLTEEARLNPKPTCVAFVVDKVKL
jgi:hypothetical protein